ncbi:uncharacterized protein APUU_70327S [Aspergillus puulaauensis]|uniref:Zn(2)-C6 fungal-type domain-containing protein n=1 Tax=Aspergillus puulaauensis TaxID=1220207 RepID=A0A7R7XWJ5_9EURO|nr:uncharacterized protein APUU_70327S [Aspergillus puulaauensis]BCS28757.1 hypothetical protein APUU_70327S [Aspergillus puulaauensis]
MRTRRAACEPCRKSKLACDHTQPVCARCRSGNRPRSCIYRAAPFKRKTRANSGQSSQQLFTPPSYPSIPNIDHADSAAPASPITPPSRYPNPGYIGSSSQVSIFNHIPLTDNTTGTGLRGERPPSTSSRVQADDDLLVQRGAEALKCLFSSFSLEYMKDLVKFWLAKGANLSLAGGIVRHCIDNIDLPLPIRIPTSPPDWHIQNAKYLLLNSSRPLEVNPSSTFSEFCDQFINQNARWETIGIFLSAVTRAAIETRFFPSLYTDEETRYTLTKLCTRAADYALEISLSLDILNDLQLFLQYENWIVHTYVHGDYSYHSWRKLGDVIASIYARGYHERLNSDLAAPTFLRELRKALFARVYSGDKNVAIFVGRPPRMNKYFCYFQIPSCPAGEDIGLLSANGTDQAEDVWQWNPDTKASFMAESRWSALCAKLKEDILYLQRERDDAVFPERVSEIKAMAEKHFSSLPIHFQHHGTLRKRVHGPFERDFIAAVRLNHLHVLFLLSLLELRTPAEPGFEIIEIAEEMALIVVDLILLRDQIVNSGTSLVWKIAHYGLPAAGILLLAMLSQRSSSNDPPPPQPKVLQHLTILAAELQAGSIIQPREPNYELMMKATQTIQIFLDSVAADAWHGSSHLSPGDMEQMGANGWAGLSGQNALDFEIGFWQELAEHPLLSLDL